MKRQAGMTLVELVITIVIIGIAAAALYSAMAAIMGRSADPLLRQQSLSIAESYLEEILLQPFLDPTALAVCQAIPGNRAAFNDVCDYRAVNDAGAQDANGNAIAGLGNYQVQVVVVPPALWNGVTAMRVDVTVTDPAGQAVVLSGFRTCYGENDNSGADRCPAP